MPATVGPGPDGPRYASSEWRRRASADDDRARSRALPRAERPLGVLRRAGRHAGARLGDRGGRRATCCAANANLGGTFLTSTMHATSSSTAARVGGLGAASARRRRGDLRREHDLAELRALAHGARDWQRGRRGRRDQARPRRATSRRGSSSPTTRARRPALRPRRRVPARPRPPALAALDRTRVVAFPWASNAVGTVTPVDEIVELAHEAGALAWSTPCTTRRTGRSTSSETGGRRAALLAVQVLRPAPRARVRAARAAPRAGARTRCGRRRDYPVGHRFETGTLAHELLCGLRRRASSTCRRRLEVHPASTSGARAAVPRRAARTAWTLHGPPTMDGRVPTFAITHAEDVARGRRGAPRRGRLRGLGRELLRGRGHEAPRAGGRRGPVGIVHYNTEDEVDRLLGGAGSTRARAAGRRGETRLLRDAALRRSPGREPAAPSASRPTGRPLRRPRPDGSATTGKPVQFQECVSEISATS